MYSTTVGVGVGRLLVVEGIGDPLVGDAPAVGLLGDSDVVDFLDPAERYRPEAAAERAAGEVDDLALENAHRSIGEEIDRHLEVGPLDRAVLRGDRGRPPNERRQEQTRQHRQQERAAQTATADVRPPRPLVFVGLNRSHPRLRVRILITSGPAIIA
jgi:hypothetical protein